jgi:hypothetical protein
VNIFRGLKLLVSEAELLLYAAMYTHTHTNTDTDTDTDTDTQTLGCFVKVSLQ